MTPLPEGASLKVMRESDVPVGAQLARALREWIAGGLLAPGDRLPSVREVASEAGVNVNTARAVYQRLEHEGLVRSEHGRGTFVARPERSGSETRTGLRRQIAALERELAQRSAHPERSLRPRRTPARTADERGRAARGPRRPARPAAPARRHARRDPRAPGGARALRPGRARWRRTRSCARPHRLGAPAARRSACRAPASAGSAPRPPPPRARSACESRRASCAPPPAVRRDGPPRPGPPGSSFTPW